MRPLDYKEHGTWQLRKSSQQWAKEERTIEAWERLAERDGLQEDAFYRASWLYADRNMALMYNKLESMTKARRYGWLGYLDSTEQLLEVLRQVLLILEENLRKRYLTFSIQGKSNFSSHIANRYCGSFDFLQR